jgi:hypothetical protein
MKKVKNKKAIVAHSSGPHGNLKQLFCANSNLKNHCQRTLRIR